jgi:hypothetical protein
MKWRPIKDSIPNDGEIVLVLAFEKFGKSADLVVAVAMCKHGTENIYWEEVSGRCTECYDFNWDVNDKPYGGVSYWLPIQIPSLAKLKDDGICFDEFRIHKTFAIDDEVTSTSQHVRDFRYVNNKLKCC